MNQKDWVDYFEALHNRKPSLQEFQNARTNGEFVVERKETVPEAPVPSAVALREKSEQAQMPSQVESRPETPAIKRFSVKWNKQTKWALSGMGILAIFVLAYFFFFQPTPSLEGIWVGPADSTAVVYELNQEEPRSYGKYKIEKVYKGNEAKQEFQKALNQLNYYKLKTLADVDRKFDLHTREVIIIKDEHGLVYNLLQSNGSNVILANDLMDLVTYSDHSESFKKNAIFHKTEIPKVLVGKWKIERSYDDETNYLELNARGILTYSEFDSSEGTAFYSLEELQKMPSTKFDQEKTADKVKEAYEDLQDAVDSQDYQLTSMKDVYKQLGSDFYYVPVNGGKTVLVFTEDYHLVEKLEKVK